MAKWIRNCFLPYQTLTNQGSACLAFFMREAFIACGWTENANDGDADWTAAANHVFTDDSGSPGFAVLASNPRRITHSGGPFTSAMVDMVIALKASNDQNASMWRIASYIDANTIEVDSVGFSPYGWVDESSIPGRVLDYGSAIHTSGAWVELDPPSGNNRVRLEINLSNYVECYVQPKAGLGTYTEIPSTVTRGAMYDDDNKAITLNAYFDDNDALFFKFADNDGAPQVVLFGELDDVPSEDTWPGFIMCTGVAIYPSQPHNFYYYMLGASSTEIEAFTLWPGEAWNVDYADNYDAKETHILRNGSPGYLPLRKSRVILDDVASNGGFERGRLPVIRIGNKHACTQYSPADAQGNWWHIKNGLFVPRNGPYDPMLIAGRVS